MTPPPSPETIDRVIGIVALYTSLRRIEPDSFLRDDLCLDDIDRDGIGADINAAFAIDVNDREVSDWTTIADIARTVDQLQRLQPVSTQPQKD